jgi:hypothetical protein
MEGKMTRTTLGARPWFFWPLLAFVAGLLIGLVVIGWGLWPVTWTNALPSDLKSDQQYEYLTMVAESYTATGDLPTAQRRLESFPSDELGTRLVDLQEFLIDTDARRAGAVQNLIAALRLESTRPQPVATPATESAVTAAGSRFATLCTSVLWAVLVIGAVVFLAWLFLRWRKAEGGSVPDFGRIFRLPRRGEPSAADIVEREKARDIAPVRSVPAPYAVTSVPLRTAPERTVSLDAEDLDEDFPLDSDRKSYPSGDDWAHAPSSRRAAEPSRDTSYERPTVPPVESPRRPLPEVVEPEELPPARSFAGSSSTPSALPTKLGEYMAVFPDETKDFYEDVFDLKDPDAGLREQDRYLGQCSVTVHRPDGITKGPSYALQLWLSDRRDSDYQVTVLMSEGAYRNTPLRAEYAGKLDVVPARPGAEIEMTTRYLILRARVEHVAYDEHQEPARGVFSQVHLRLIAYKRPA